MVAGAPVRPDPQDVDVDLMDQDDVKRLLKACMDYIKNKDEAKEDEQRDDGDGQGRDGGWTKNIANFGSKNVGKPSVWDGENEETFKIWHEELTKFMATAGDKIWKDIIKHIQHLSEDFYFEDEKR